jgi:hypothetical protein
MKMKNIILYPIGPDGWLTQDIFPVFFRLNFLFPVFLSAARCTSLQIGYTIHYPSLTSFIDTSYYNNISLLIFKQHPIAQPTNYKWMAKELLSLSIPSNLDPIQSGPAIL